MVRRSLLSVIAVLVLTALLLIFPPTRLVGLLLCALVIAAFLLLVITVRARGWPVRMPARQARQAPLLLGLAALLLALAFLSVVGKIEQSSYAYTWHYGHAVSVDLPRGCLGEQGNSKVSCEDIPWNDGGKVVRGTVELTSSEFYAQHESSLTAHALGDHAVSKAAAGSVGSDVLLGKVPIFVAPVAFVLALIPTVLWVTEGRRERHTLAVTRRRATM